MRKAQRRRPWIVRTAAAVTLLGSIIGPLSSSAGAEAPETLSIIATVSDGPGFSGVWTSSGSIQDAGTFARTDVHFSGSVEHSPVVGAFQVLLDFTGADGTITIRDELLFAPDGLSGTWQVVRGTGAYANTSGHGTSEFDFSTGSTLFTGVASVRA